MKWPLPLLNSRLYLCLKGALSAVLLTAVLLYADVDSSLAVLASVKLPWLGAAFGLYFIGYFLGALRWRLLLRLCDTEAPIWFLFGSYVIATFFNTIMPSTIGGDTVRAIDTTRLGVSKVDAVTTIVIDRVLGVFALGIFAIGGLLALTGQLHLKAQLIAPVLVVMTTILVVLAIILRPSRSPSVQMDRVAPRRAVLAAVDKASQALRMSLSRFHGQFGVLCKCIFLALLLQSNVIAFHFLTAGAVGIDIELVAFAVVVPVALIVLMLPITIGGIGLRESIFLVLLVPYGVEEPAILAFSVLIYGQTLVQGLIGWLVLMLRRGRGGATTAFTP